MLRIRTSGIIQRKQKLPIKTEIQKTYAEIAKNYAVKHKIAKMERIREKKEIFSKVPKEGAAEPVQLHQLEKLNRNFLKVTETLEKK